MGELTPSTSVVSASMKVRLAGLEPRLELVDRGLGLGICQDLPTHHASRTLKPCVHPIKRIVGSGNVRGRPEERLCLQPAGLFHALYGFIPVKDPWHTTATPGQLPDSEDHSESAEPLVSTGCRPARSSGISPSWPRQVPTWRAGAGPATSRRSRRPRSRRHLTLSSVR